jgi:cob(I)alamin adenosyltransferase
MKIYTKKGDQGMTSLFGGVRLSKDHIRIEAYGTVDELNSVVGLVYSAYEEEGVQAFLHKVQSDLFSLGSYLACDPEKPLIDLELYIEDVEMIEAQIDNMEEVLPKLKHFILPGGSNSIALCHLARTVCRRAERRLVSLSDESKVNHLCIQYVNRLSDYFFVLARFVAFQHEIEEIKWKPRSKQ